MMANQLNQAVQGMKKAEEYINLGYDTIPDYATEFVDLGLGDSEDGANALKEQYKELMKEYIEMDNDLKSYIKAIETITPMVCSILVGSSSKSSYFNIGSIQLINVINLFSTQTLSLIFYRKNTFSFNFQNVILLQPKYFFLSFIDLNVM